MMSLHGKSHVRWERDRDRDGSGIATAILGLKPQSLTQTSVKFQQCAVDKALRVWTTGSYSLWPALGFPQSTGPTTTTTG